MTRITSNAPTAEEIKTLLQFAMLAPSSHNTQPWSFDITGSNIHLYADRTRALAVNDPDDRELTISCGCALLNIRVAAAEAGIYATTMIRPDQDSEDLLATVHLAKLREIDSSLAALFPAISNRRTYRKRFEPRHVPENILKELNDAAAQESAWLKVIASEEGRHRVADLVTEGDIIQWANASWRRELAAWMHPRRKGDGLMMSGMMTPVAKVIIRTVDMGNGVGEKDKHLAEESPLVVVLGTEQDDTSDWIAAGQALQRVLLSANCHGLQASFLNQPIQVATLRTKLQHVIKAWGFPQIVLRLGYTTETLPPTPRRPLDDVVE